MIKHDLSNDNERMLQNIIRDTAMYARRAELKSLVLGMSGGVDSALVAYIGRKVADLLGIKLIGAYLHIIGNDKEERKRAIALCENYCDDQFIESLTDSYLYTLHSVEGTIWKKIVSPYGGDLTHEEKIRAGNVKARCRMIYLYNLAQKYGGLVLSTDNFTEYNLGFWTLHGDVGDFGPIQQLWKTEVYSIAEYIGTKEHDDDMLACVDAKPTDGLGITNSDIDQILPNWTPEMGSFRDAYRLVDVILIDRLSGGAIYASDHPVIERHIATEFKRTNPVSIKREEILRPRKAKVVPF